MIKTTWEALLVVKEINFFCFDQNDYNGMMISMHIKFPVFEAIV